MPELPEVETIVRQLTLKVLQKKITTVEIIDRNFVKQEMLKSKGAVVIDIFRRAKSINIALDNGYLIQAHLGMTGSFNYLPKSISEEKLKKALEYGLVKFTFNDGSILIYNNIRKFGYIRLLDKHQLEKELAKYGPEPLSEEFTFEKFKEIMYRKRKANLKTTLMDQKIISGIGNIYAQEILYSAGISVLKKINTLTEKEMGLIYRKMREILLSAINHGGSTVDNYSHLDGTGGFQDYLKIYGREKCPQGHATTKITIGGRGTSYCKKCQK